MANFIHLVFDFFKQVYDAIYNELGIASLTRTFLDSKIIEGSLIDINLTWSQLLKFLLPTITVFLFIYLVYKIIYKVIGLISFK